MIRTIIQNGFDADYRISSQRAFLYGFLDTFFNSREVVLRNGAADNFLLENVWFLEISGSGEAHFYMTVLAVAAGLFFVFCFYIRIFADRLAEGYLRTGQLYFYFVALQQLADDNIDVLVAHAVQQCLMVCRIIDCLHSQVFLHHLGKGLGDLIYIGFVLRFISFCGVRSRNIRFSVADLIVLCRKGIACSCIAEFCDGTDISCMKLRYFDRLGAFEHVQLAQFFFGFLIYIIEHIIAFNNAGANLNH